MSVTATARALEAIALLEASHGRLAFFQSGGCCDGSSPICLIDGELRRPPATACSGTSEALRSTSTPTSTSAGGGPSWSSTSPRTQPRDSSAHRTGTSWRAPSRPGRRDRRGRTGEGSTAYGRRRRTAGPRGPCPCACLGRRRGARAAATAAGSGPEVGRRRQRVITCALGRPCRSDVADPLPGASAQGEGSEAEGGQGWRRSPRRRPRPRRRADLRAWRGPARRRRS